jgi:sugar/nucleoside kinase (ribokinase family)
MTIPEPAIICIGMIVVDVLARGMGTLPRTGETGFASSISLATGGDAMNQASVLTKLGHHPGLMGLIGDDAQGEFIRQSCAKRNISTLGLAIDPKRPTSTVVVMIDNAGEHIFIAPHNATHKAYGPEHIDLDLIKPGLKVLSIGSLFCAEAFDRKALVPVLRKAKAVGATTIADMVMDERNYGLDGLNEAWPYLDYAVPSMLEGELFTGSNRADGIANAFRKRGVKNVIVKQGLCGVTAFIGDETYQCPAFNVQAVDTTGAGDSFVAGFVHALIHDYQPDRALRFASACAALSIQEVGAGAGLKSLKQVEEFLRVQSVV